jgi:hypothetical protein
MKCSIGLRASWRVLYVVEYKINGSFHVGSGDGCDTISPGTPFSPGEAIAGIGKPVSEVPAQLAVNGFARDTDIAHVGVKGARVRVIDKIQIALCPPLLTPVGGS